MTLQAPLGTKHVYGEEHVRNVLMVGVSPPPLSSKCLFLILCLYLHYRHLLFQYHSVLYFFPFFN